MNGSLGALGPDAFIAIVLAASLRLSLFRVWLVSGAAGLTYLLLKGGYQGRRIWSSVPIVLLIGGLNLTCAAASTSWLFYWVFVTTCWPCILITSIYQFDGVADIARHSLRRLLQKLHFTADKIALFEIPALEIDVDVAGLLVIRGITLSLSSLTIVAHGIEVGIKLSDDMELAIQVGTVTVSLFRSIQVDDVYANVKGGEFEMTFGKLAQDSRDENGAPLMDEDTPLLKAPTTWSSEDAENYKEPDKVRMADKMTDGREPEPSSPITAAQTMRQFAADDDEASLLYQRTLDEIEKTDEINIARKEVNRLAAQQASEQAAIDLHNVQHIRAAICSQLHDKPSIQHPPKSSIRVTTLQKLNSPWVRRLLHRLPMLLRLLLNPLAYFHPVNISSITVAASGRWLQSLVGSQIFSGYGQGNDIRKLRERIFNWLSDANFVAQLSDVTASAQVPFLTNNDISARLVLEDIMAYRSQPREIRLTKVMSLAGADATLIVPSFLLPHHEHLLPSKEQQKAEQKTLRMIIEASDGLPRAKQAQSELERIERDETHINVSAHARLPVTFDQELLNFVAALVKATKIIEFEKDGDKLGLDTEVHGFREFGKVIGSTVKSHMKQATVNAAANDRWIAKMVGKVTRKLENMQGDFGYSGNLPISLKWYRDTAETSTKLLP